MILGAGTRKGGAEGREQNKKASTAQINEDGTAVPELDEEVAAEDFLRSINAGARQQS